MLYIQCHSSFTYAFIVYILMKLYVIINDFFMCVILIKILEFFVTQAYIRNIVQKNCKIIEISVFWENRPITS